MVENLSKIVGFKPEVTVSKSKLWYFATPYGQSTDNTDSVKFEIENKNYKLTLDRVNILLDLGYIVYSPIINNHMLHRLVFREWSFWMECDDVILKKCYGLILAPGWKFSVGCIMEKQKFESLNKPILYFNDLVNEVSKY